MKQHLSLVKLALVAIGLSGCSGGGSELKPATETKVDPAVAHAKMEAMKKESMEKAKAAQSAAPGGQ